MVETLRNLVSPTIANASNDCVGDCVPEGFWALVITSISVLLALVLLLMWAASPQQCCRCCSHMGRGFKGLWKESRQRLLPSEARTRETGNGAREGNDEGIELEGWWELQPQTEKEKELVKRRQQQEQEREQHRKQMEDAPASSRTDKTE
jgi:hypothetical protein